MAKNVSLSDFSVLNMQWGVKPPTAAAYIHAAQEAERLGFYAVTIPHLPLLPYGEDRPDDGTKGSSQIWAHIPKKYRDYQLDALVLAPMVVQATSTIRVGFNVLVTPWAHPFAWAKYLASLDVASGGRAVAGFGLSGADANGWVKMLDSFGQINGKKRGGASDEALQQITTLWQSETPVIFEGEFFRGRDLIVEPKPLQTPYPEIWWAGHLKTSITRAARYARFLELAIFGIGPAPFDRIRSYYRPLLEEENAKWGGSAKIMAFMYANVLDADLTRAELSARYWGWKGDILDTLAVGRPERVAQVIAELREAGVDHFCLDLARHGYDDITTLDEQMQRFAGEVVPLLGRPSAPTVVADGHR